MSLPFLLVLLSAGKTTLLDVLAGRKTVGTIAGDIRVNGRELSKVEFGRVTAFAEQADIHVSTATVREALEFSAALRLAASVIDAGRRTAVVSETLRLLELTPIAGRTVSSLSPSELKRVTIGVELCANPSILFLGKRGGGGRA